MIRKFICFSLLVCMTFLFVSGCNSKEVSAPASERLTYWRGFWHFNHLGDSFNDSALANELRLRTGVDVEFISPPHDKNVSTSLRLLMAAGNYPDIIEYTWLGSKRFDFLPVEVAIRDGFVMPLNDVIDLYAPNFKAYLNKNPDVLKRITTGDGHYYAFPFIRGDDSLRVNSGFFLRKDWLDMLDMPVPETIDDWYRTLSAFKNIPGVEYPFHSHEGGSYMFMSAYNISTSFYVDNGKVKFGPIEDACEDYLRTINKWYSEGLIDPHCISGGDTQHVEKISSGSSGASFGLVGSAMGKAIRSGKSGESFSLTGAKYPVLNRGDSPEF